MMVFTDVATGTPVTAGVVQQLLIALNALNAAGGRPEVTWTNILSPGTPPLAPGVLIYADHIMSVKNAMGAALDAVGVARPPGPNISPGLSMNHTDIAQLQGWAQ